MLETRSGRTRHTLRVPLLLPQVTVTPSASTFASPSARAALAGTEEEAEMRAQMLQYVCVALLVLREQVGYA